VCPFSRNLCSVIHVLLSSVDWTAYKRTAVIFLITGPRFLFCSALTSKYSLRDVYWGEVCCLELSCLCYRKRLWQMKWSLSGITDTHSWCFVYLAFLEELLLVSWLSQKKIMEMIVAGCRACSFQHAKLTMSKSPTGFRTYLINQLLMKLSVKWDDLEPTYPIFT